MSCEPKCAALGRAYGLTCLIAMPVQKVTAGTSAAESFLMEKPLGKTLLGLLIHPSGFMSWVSIEQASMGFGFCWEAEILSILNSLTIQLIQFLSGACLIRWLCFAELVPQ